MSARILLVDDDWSVSLTLSALLEEEGYVVETAGSVAAVRKWLAAPPACEVVILDLRLGGALGTELLPDLRQRLPGAKILLLTGEQDVEEPAKVDAVLRKGEPFERLLTKLQTLL
jgi:two-component system, response regulator RegA